jgi:hypothetical protein
MTDWDKQLRRRRAAIDRDNAALRQDVAAARLDGMSFRDIGTSAGINHERARQIAKEINGDTRTAAEREAEAPPTD